MKQKELTKLVPTRDKSNPRTETSNRKQPPVQEVKEVKEEAPGGLGLKDKINKLLSDKKTKPGDNKTKTPIKSRK